MVVRRRAKGRAERPPVEVRRRLDFGPHQQPLRRALRGPRRGCVMSTPRATARPRASTRAARPRGRPHRAATAVAARASRQERHRSTSAKIEPAARAARPGRAALPQSSRGGRPPPTPPPRVSRTGCSSWSAHGSSALSVAARAASECSEVGLVEATSGRLVARTPCNALQSNGLSRCTGFCRTSSCAGLFETCPREGSPACD